MMNSLAVNKWSGLIASIWVEATAGNGYTFAFFAPALKQVMGYNQQQINMLGVAKDLGDNVGLVAGVASEFTYSAVILLTGGLVSFFGYGLLWLVASERITPLPFWQMCVLICIGANSSSWLETAALVTSLQNFPYSRGPVTGILKSSYGLSSAIFTILYTAFFSSDPASFPLLVAIAPLVIGLMAAFFIPVIRMSSSKVDEKEDSYLFFLQAISVALTLYVLLVCLSDYLFQLSSLTYRLCAALLLLFLITTVAVPIKHALNVSEATSISVHNSDEASQNLLVTAKHVSPTEEQQTLHGVGVATTARREFTLTEALATVNFWLLFFTLCCGVGSGITAMNNLGQIGEALGYADVSIFVSLMSVWNSIGRLSAGAISEHFLRSAAIPRSLWISFAQILMIAGHLFLAFPFPGSLYAGASLVGLSYGVLYAVAAVATSEIFGLQHLGMIYNFVTMANPVGSLVFSGLVAGYLYDQEAEKAVSLSTLQMPISPSDESHCLGSHCFRLTFIIMAVVCIVGGLLNLILTHRTRILYRALYSERLVTSADTSTQEICQ